MTLVELKAEYAPYNTMAAFEQGFADYKAGFKSALFEGADAQAYDRGAECAMRWQRRKLHKPGQI